MLLAVVIKGQVTLICSYKLLTRNGLEGVGVRGGGVVLSCASVEKVRMRSEIFG